MHQYLLISTELASKAIHSTVYVCECVSVFVRMCVCMHLNVQTSQVPLLYN